MAAAVRGACIREVSPDGELLMAFMLSAKLGLFFWHKLAILPACQLIALLSNLAVFVSRQKERRHPGMADPTASADITVSEQTVVYPGTAKTTAVSPIRIVPEKESGSANIVTGIPCCE